MDLIRIKKQRGDAMKVNENTTKGKWLEMKGDIQKAWGKLTDDDLDKRHEKKNLKQ